MAKHNISLMIAVVLALLFFIVTMVFSALAAPGIYPFLESTSNISEEFVTQITPSGWTFTIWTIIYIFLASVLAFVFTGIFRNPAILPHGFFVTLCLNLSLNTAWLFLWDRRLMPAALVFLILIAFTNYIVIFFSCHGLHIYGAWLDKYHKVDLWLHRVLVQNGVAIYATWTTIASLVNLTIVLISNANMSQTDAATLTLSILTVVLLVWFVLENSVLDKHVRYILIIYPVVIWTLTGIFTKNYDTAAPTRNNIFTAALLAAACALFVARVVLVIWRNIKNPLYKDVSPEVMTPMEIAKEQKKIFK
uniref:uncharacterized protein si:ch211-161h7.5 n=1 Tax=Scatophagus argus TaxID=75038 RepID=UPI001ED82D8E|nr:uncharacterized protein si:ch211-161h7.5 [Scatophagus argus]